MKLRRGWFFSGFIPWLVLHVICLIFNFSTTSSAQSANGVTASGLITAARFLGGTPLHPSHPMSFTNEFRVSVSPDGRWVFEVRRVHKEGDVMYGKEDVRYMTFNGVDTYWCDYSEAVWGLKGGREGITGFDPATNRAAMAYISSGNYPFTFFDTHEKSPEILWMVYGIGDYIRNSQTDNMPLPWVTARQELRAYGFRYESELLPEPPHVPNQLRFIRDSGLDLPSEDREMDRPELDKPHSDQRVESWRSDLQERRKEYTNGFTVGQLEIGSLTNWNGLVTPLSFTFKVFLPRLSEPDHVWWLYVGTVTNVADLSSDEQFVPPITATRVVHDSRIRFRDAHHQMDETIYVLKAGQKWWSRDSRELERQVQAEVPFAPGARYIPRLVRLRRLIEIGILLLVMLLLPVYLYRKSHAKSG